MSVEQQLLDALGHEITRLNREMYRTKQWLAEIEAGERSAELIKHGLTKRDMRYWARGANTARQVARDRLAKVYDRLDARINGR